MSMFTAAVIGVVVTMAIALARAVIGPTIYDRILAVNSFGTVTVLAIAVFGFLMGRPEFLDIALIYALINFVGTIAVLKFLRYGDLARASSQQEEDI
jgi:multicomponent Na+:H+ antiporter subunit F